VGVPANNFGNQEPDSNEKIAEFCTTKYKVTFDMLAKVSVAGDDQCDLYKFLTSKDTNPKHPGKIEWNFEKFIISRKGEVAARFKPGVKPDSEEFVKALEAELDVK
jgi:glutathione peroxidase